MLLIHSLHLAKKKIKRGEYHINIEFTISLIYFLGSTKCHCVFLIFEENEMAVLNAKNKLGHIFIAHSTDFLSYESFTAFGV